MINNYICLNCDKQDVCKIMDTLAKFDENAKKDLGVNITINSCENYNNSTEESNVDFGE